MITKDVHGYDVEIWGEGVSLSDSCLDVDVVSEFVIDDDFCSCLLINGFDPFNKREGESFCFKCPEKEVVFKSVKGFFLVNGKEEGIFSPCFQCINESLEPDGIV